MNEIGRHRIGIAVRQDILDEADRRCAAIHRETAHRVSRGKVFEAALARFLQLSKAEFAEALEVV